MQYRCGDVQDLTQSVPRRQDAEELLRKVPAAGWERRQHGRSASTKN